MRERRREAARRPPRREGPIATDVAAAPARRDRRALACCVLAVLALALALVLVLARAEPRRSGTNGVFPLGQINVPAGLTACQPGERLPAGTGAVQIRGVTTAPPVVTVRSGGRVLARADGAVDERHSVIRAPLAPLPHDVANVKLCIAFAGPAALLRGPTPPHHASAIVQGPTAGSSLAVDYVLAGQRSWWDFAPTVATRMGRGHGAWGGGWTPWAVVALIAAALALTGAVVARTLIARRPPPRIAGTIMAVAALQAVAWSLATPPFQVPDEVGHVAYVQSLGETGHAPLDPPALTLSPEEATVMADTRFGRVGAPTRRDAVWSSEQQRRLAADLRRPLSRRQTIAAYEAEPEPPLYYALEAIPYRIAHQRTLLDRLALMRLTSALLAGVTALLCFLFVRECLPGRSWTWGVGGLGVALLPMLGFISGGVNPDGLMLAFAAGLFLCIARAWRRGVTMRLALAVGAVIGAGVLTKVNFYGLVPGALVGLALAARRTQAAWDRRAVGFVGAAVAVAAGLFAAGAALEGLAWHRSLFAARPVAPESHVDLWSHVGYVWQVFLPRLPFQPHTSLSEPGYVQLFETFVGTFGQLVVFFPVWVYRVLALGLVLVGALAVRALYVDQRKLRRCGRELLGYAAMAAGLMLLIGLSADLRRHLITTVQGRYLLPLLPLLALLLALAARGAGERWGRSVGVVIVCTVAALSLYAQLVTIAFFYS